MSEANRVFDIQRAIDGEPEDPGYVKWFADEVKRRAEVAYKVIDDIANLRVAFDSGILQRAELAFAELRALEHAVEHLWREKFQKVGYASWKATVMEAVTHFRMLGDTQISVVREWFGVGGLARPIPDGL